jgi:hypothetical protein
VLDYIRLDDLPEKPTAASQYRYSNSHRTNDIWHWLWTDGPVDEQAMQDLKKSIRTQSRVGMYETSEVSGEWDGEQRPRIHIRGPHRTLVLVEAALKKLAKDLKYMLEMGLRKEEPTPKPPELFFD